MLNCFIGSLACDGARYAERSDLTPSVRSLFHRGAHLSVAMPLPWVDKFGRQACGFLAKASESPTLAPLFKTNSHPHARTSRSGSYVEQLNVDVDPVGLT